MAVSTTVGGGGNCFICSDNFLAVMVGTGGGAGLTMRGAIFTGFFGEMCASFCDFFVLTIGDTLAVLRSTFFTAAETVVAEMVVGAAARFVVDVTTGRTSKSF